MARKIKIIQIEKEIVKLPLFVDDMILYVENSKELKNILKLINEFEFKGHRSIYKNHLYFYAVARDKVKMTLRN